MAATDNLMQIISAEKIGFALIQEPYLYQNRALVIIKECRTFTSVEGKSRTTIIIPDNAIDALLITPLPDKDTIILAIDNGHRSFHAASIYLDYNEPIKNKKYREIC